MCEEGVWEAAQGFPARTSGHVPMGIPPGERERDRQDEHAVGTSSGSEDRCINEFVSGGGQTVWRSSMQQAWEKHVQCWHEKECQVG